MKQYSLILILMLPIALWSQDKAKLNTTSFDGLDIAFAKADKPAVILLTTSWCRYCKAMQQKTFADPEVVALLNNHFYFVPFDGESRTAVDYRGVRFQYRPSGKKTGTHELAIELAKSNKNGILEYPMIVVIDKDLQVLLQQSGFINAQDMARILKTIRE